MEFGARGPVGLTDGRSHGAYARCFDRMINDARVPRLCPGREQRPRYQRYAMVDETVATHAIPRQRGEASMRTRSALLIATGVIIVMVAVGSAIVFMRGDRAQLPETASIGPSPTILPPTPTLIPTVEIAPAKGWSNGGKPTPATGLAVSAFATG